MKTLTAILLASGLAILTTVSVSAQEQTPTIPPQGFPMQTFVMCDSVEKMESVLKRYGETPMVQGQGSFFMSNGQQLSGMTQFWFNNETKTFTVTIKNNGYMCMLTSGT